jgi:ABC-type amino acid transport substrate-binding protein
MASSLARLASCPSQSLNLVCKILISLLGLSETNTIGYEALLTGTVDAVVYDAPNLLYYAKHQGQGRVAVVGKLFAPQDYAVAVRQGSPLRKQINLAMATLAETGAAKGIRAKWFGN